jgi:hypothetical protein
MATKKFIVYTKSVASSNYEYDINTVSNIFVQELYACYFTVNLYIVRHLGSYSRKIIFFVIWPVWRKWRVESKQQYIFV